MPIEAPTRMSITAYTDPGFSSKAATATNPFTVWINPASYAHKTQIRYNDRQAQGSSGPSPEFNRVGEEEISFELVFDATGVVPPVSGQSYSNGVADGVAQFTSLLATVNGTIHSPNYLILSWAQLQFQCVLYSMNINYTLFRPDGTPLRAKLSLTFQSYTSETQLAKQANLNSPDLTHLVTVNAGDTLPLLCHRIYGDSNHYLKVAHFNGLHSFRDVRPGTQLLFPPLTGSA
jgi:phage protein U